MKLKMIKLRILAPALVLLCAAACSGGKGNSASNALRPLPSGPPSVLLVTIDTWRWDYIGASGQGMVKTPNLDRLVKEGTYYSKAQVSCPLTTPSHATILTGLTPFHHGIHDNEHYRLGGKTPTLATLFGKGGYETMAVVSGAPLRAVYGLNRGFDSYDDSGLGREGDDSFSPARRKGEATTRIALSMLNGADSATPVFMWVHYYDLHAPRRPPEAFLEEYPDDVYAAAAAFEDAQVGRLLAFLRNDNRRWVVLVTGDHGEGLGDHGEQTHGVLLYESTVEVPLVLWASWTPLKAPEGGQCALVDVAPTLCSLAGIKAPAGLDGVDLLRGIPAGRWLSCETAYPAISYGVEPPFQLRRGGRVWIRQAVQEVYDLDSDPGEKKNLFATRAGRAFATEARDVFSRFFGEYPLRAFSGVTLSLSPGELDALKGLGYIGGSMASPRSLERVDIRVFVKDRREYDDALRLYSAGKYGEARRALGRFLKKYPRSSRGWMEMGNVMVAEKRFGEAEKSFSRALKLDPADAVSSLNLGNLKMMRGDAKGALKLYERSLAIDDEQAEAHLNAALVLVKMLHRPMEATGHLERFLDLAPNDPQAPAIRRLLASIENDAQRRSSG